MPDLVSLSPISDFLVVRITATPAAPVAPVLIHKISEPRNEPLRGVVLAAGPGRIESGCVLPMPCAVGDTVLLQFNAGSEVTLDGEVVRIVPAKDIYGVLSA